MKLRKLKDLDRVYMFTNFTVEKCSPRSQNTEKKILLKFRSQLYDKVFIECRPFNEDFTI